MLARQHIFAMYTFLALTPAPSQSSVFGNGLSALTPPRMHVERPACWRRAHRQYLPAQILDI